MNFFALTAALTETVSGPLRLLSGCLVMLTVVGSPSAHADNPANKAPYILHHTVKPAQTLSEILFELGIGTPQSSYRLYGAEGWVQKNMDRNPHLNWNHLSPGTQIILELPASMNPEAQANAAPAGDAGIETRTGAEEQFEEAASPDTMEAVTEEAAPSPVFDIAQTLAAPPSFLQPGWGLSLRHYAISSPTFQYDTLLVQQHAAQIDGEHWFSGHFGGRAKFTYATSRLITDDSFASDGNDPVMSFARGNLQVLVGDTLGAGQYSVGLGMTRGWIPELKAEGTTFSTANKPADSLLLSAHVAHPIGSSFLGNLGLDSTIAALTRKDIKRREWSAQADVLWQMNQNFGFGFGWLHQQLTWEHDERITIRSRADTASLLSRFTL